MEMLYPPERIDAPRIFLERLEPYLADLIFRHVDEERARLERFLPWVDDIRSTEDELEFILRSRDWWQAQQQFDYGMFLKEGGVYIGNIGLCRMSWANDRGELGYWVLSRFEGQGYVSEAVRVLGDTLFDLGFHRLEIRCSPANTRSARIPERAGYRLEGILREDTLIQGRYQDSLVYSRLRTDPAPEPVMPPVLP